MIQISEIKKRYKDFELNCSMEVKPGCITGLIGQNGAGKSTTFKAILGLITPESGEIKVFGKNIGELETKDKERIGVVLSDSGFSNYMTINDIIPILSNLYSEFDKEAFVAMCERFGLPFKKKLKEFSTGMAVKFKCIVAVTHNAKLLIMDEPTVGLDVVAREDMIDILREYMEQDPERSILISSHISSDLEGLCDDIYMIDNGQIILHEETDAIINKYGILKLSKEEFETIDKSYILRVKEEKYEVICLTNERQFYTENYPRAAIEKGSIDEIIMMMIRGKNV